MSDLVRRVTFDRFKKTSKTPEFQTGDTVGVYVRVKEGEKERVQLYTGVVMKVQGSGISRSFTVRKIASGVGVERTFPIASPIIEKVEIITRGKVRRSRLFFLRGLKGRSARLESKEYFSGEGQEGAAGEVAETAAVETAPAAEATPAPKAPAKKESAKKAPAKK